ncbi:hypothetical protein BaRGS_00036214 [Batillaria attramentaria]|uniref:Uncharacterized protein n=1 Tax=Batillaria attramentaria TaxID=370345 RepID=A0ABD0JCM6_9CAEN
MPNRFFKGAPKRTKPRGERMQVWIRCVSILQIQHIWTKTECRTRRNVRADGTILGEKGDPPVQKAGEGAYKINLLKKEPKEKKTAQGKPVPAITTKLRLNREMANVAGQTNMNWVHSGYTLTLENQRTVHSTPKPRTVFRIEPEILRLQHRPEHCS